MQEAAEARPATDSELNKLLARMTTAERALEEHALAHNGAKKSRRALNEAYAKAVDLTKLEEFKKVRSKTQ